MFGISVFKVISIFALCSTTVTGAIINPNGKSHHEIRFDKNNVAFEEEPCHLDQALIGEIKGYEEVATNIREAALNGKFKGVAHLELTKFVDTYINRMSGSPELEASIDYMMQKMRDDGLANVRAENVEVPHWIRGEETALLIEPSIKKMNILGLGRSVGTPLEGITAQVIVVKSFEELEQIQNKVAGKIVVYNQGWLGSYGETAQYRGNGAIHAAKYGAVAALVESVAPYSLDTPHTGLMNYEDGVKQIPAASVTKEDAEMLHRMYKQGQKIVMNLTMLDKSVETAVSRNTIGEIIGTSHPDEIIMVSSHIDAWDVGQGAVDDAGGVILAIEAMALLKNLGLVPKRTLQAMAWTAEEFGLIGAATFVQEHQEDMIKYKAAFEADIGVFRPTGIDFAGTHEAGCIVKEVLKLMEPINATMYTRYPSVGSDISYLIQEGVPGLSLANENEKYFWFHHSPADMITILDSTELDMNVALWATVSYVLADLTVALPRETPKQI